MTAPPWFYDDGGRAGAGFKGKTGDCAARAVAIATRQPYREVYDALNVLARTERPRGKRTRSSARDGYHSATLRRYMASIGWRWVSCMGIGTGCTAHLREGDPLPTGRAVLRLSRHYTALIEGLVCDTHDPARGGSRCVYGYWVEGASVQA